MFAARCLCAVLLLAVVAPVRAALPEFTQLVKDVGPAVVNISTTQKARQQEMFPGFPMDPDDPRSEFFRRFFGAPPGGRARHRRNRIDQTLPCVDVNPRLFVCVAHGCRWRPVNAAPL